MSVPAAAADVASSSAAAAPPLDLSAPYDPAHVRGSTILMTGGAGGLAEPMFRSFAQHGATVIISDIDSARGTDLVNRVRAESGNGSLHFYQCDVRSWQSQNELFKAALKHTGRINSVIVCAGVGEPVPLFANLPAEPFDDDPEEPSLQALDVNLKGAVYTIRLFLHYSRRCGAGEDKNLLVVGSLASFLSLPLAGLYSASKHGLLGLFRSLRFYPGNSDGIRMNLVAPYFVDTPLLSEASKTLLIGVDLARAEDVVAATERLLCSPGIHGRCLAVSARETGGIMEVDLTTMAHVDEFTQRISALLKARSGFRAAMRTVKVLAERTRWKERMLLLAFISFAVWCKWYW